MRLKMSIAVRLVAPCCGALLTMLRCGSQREERLDVLDAKLKEKHLSEELWWYRDLRRYGTVPHAGFGLGFERLVLYMTGMENIRDAAPFPRVPDSAAF